MPTEAVCVVPAKVLVIFAGFLSSVASLGGGLLLYFEGLDMLEQTVRQGARSDLTATSTVLLQTMELPKKVADKYRLMLANLGEVNGGQWETAYQLSQYLTPISTFDVYTSGIYGVGFQAYSAENPADNATGMADYAWYDVLEDGSREYIHAHYNTTLYNAKYCSRFCTLCYAVNPETAKYKYFAYNYSDAGADAVAEGGAWYDSLRGWEVEPVSFWRRPSVWYAYDGTPALFLTYVAGLPRMDSIAVLRGLQPLVLGYGNLAEWTEQFANIESTVTMVVVTKRGEVLASNLDTTLVRKGCTNSNNLDEECLFFLRGLPRYVQDAARVLNNTAPGVFVREGGYWLSRSILFEPTPRDQLDEVSLLWIRDTNSVEAEMTRALILFIIFLLLVLVLDALIGVTEMLTLARPLGRLAEAVAHLEVLDLDAVEDGLVTVRTCVSIKEVVRLVDGLAFAVSCIREYKSYLPQSVLGNALDSSDTEAAPDTTAASSTESPSKISNSSISTHTKLGVAKPRLGLGVTEGYAVVAVLQMAEKPDERYVGMHTQWIETIQAGQKRCRATLYRMLGDRTVMSWTSPGRAGLLPQLASEFCLVTRETCEGQLAGMSAGHVRMGNMGTNTLRSFNLLGPVVWRADALCSLNQPFSTTVLLDRMVSKGIEGCGTFKVRPVDNVRFEGDRVPMEVFEVIGMHAECNEEWMYTTERTSNSKYDLVWKLVLRDVEAGLVELRALPHDPVVGALIDRVETFHRSASVGAKYTNTVRRAQIMPLVTGSTVW